MSRRAAFRQYIERIFGIRDRSVSRARSKFLITLAAVFAMALHDGVTHASDGTGTLVGDIDCDGSLDAISYTATPETVRVEVRLNGKHSRSGSISFSIGAHSQASLCAVPVRVVLESQDFDSKDDPGSLPGFRRSKVCQGIVLDDEQCDVIHIYWNHDTHALAWWRH